MTLYLLNPTHPAGGSKAAFFLHFGFTVGQWQVLAETLRRHALENEVVASEETPHGVRYAVDGPMNAPAGEPGQSHQKKRRNYGDYKMYF